MPGPSPKPTTLLKLTGSWRAAAREKTEPKPAAIAPQCPDWLDAEGVRAWRQLTPILARMRVLTEADQFALAILCEAWSRYLKVTEHLRAHGDAYRSGLPQDDSRLWKRSPYSRLQTELAMTIRGMLQEFGLTPSSRGRIVTLPDQSSIGKKALFTKPPAS